MRILFVCTANRCRSPMAAAILRALLDAHGIAGVEVASAGLLPGGAPATADAVAVVGALAGHVSRTVSGDMVATADLVVGMTREHVRELAVAFEGCFPRVFTLKELVRRAEAVGPRAPGETPAAWLGRVGSGRSPLDLLGASPDDDIDDPVGRPRAVYRRTAEELEQLLGRFVGLAWPAAAGSVPPGGSLPVA